MDQQPRITDLVPKKYSTYAILLAVGLLIVGALEGLYAWMPTVAAHSTDGRVAAFDLDGEGSLGACFSSALLAMAAVGAWLVYYIRRHKSDDYQGRYRVWLWAGLCWMLMAIDESGSLHEGFKELMVHVTGQRVFGDGSVWWIGAYVLTVGTIGLRLLLDMRCCRTSTAALVGVAACYVTAVLSQVEVIWPESGAKGVMLEEGCEMAGNLLLVLAMLLHARYVILEASGLITRKEPKAKPAKTETKTAASDTTTTKRHDLGTTTKPTPTATTPAKPAARPVAEQEEDDYEDAYEDEDNSRDRKARAQYRYDDEEDEPQGDHRKLSKAERKAMRRQKERQRRGGMDDE